ncbi:hypothetical protein SAMN04490188_5651 [Pseudomonas kilonensis]|uniref:Uncharacterized protein n=1 Tax=Pseudomonas kilonensis TaxID=132476 RepID=A0ABY0ZIR4_9PSED|nr:hypothetical protein SAMN04490188_5651 [Pseudomonas kilonensis]
MQRCITFSLQHHETVDKSLKIPAAWYKPPFCGARSADFAGCSRRGRRAVFLWVCGQLWCAKRLCKALFSAESTLGAAASASAVNGLPSSRAGSLPQEGWWWTQVQGPPPILCGSGLARESGGSACRCGEWAAVIASKLAPTGGWWWTQVQGPPPILCGSEPARESGGSACRCGEWAGVFASRLAPTGGVVDTGSRNAADPLWERACSRWRWFSRNSALFRPSVRPPGSSPTPAPARCAVCARAPAG